MAETETKTKKKVTVEEYDIIPMSDQVILEVPPANPVTPSGVIKPDSVRDKEQEQLGSFPPRVLAMGEQAMKQHPNLNIGDRVILVPDIMMKPPMYKHPIRENEVFVILSSYNVVAKLDNKGLKIIADKIKAIEITAEQEAVEIEARRAAHKNELKVVIN